MNLRSGWDNLWAQIGGNFGGVLALIGVGIIAVSLIVWFYRNRRGGAGRFPWMLIILGLLLAGPSVVLPVLLSLIEALINVAITIFGNLTRMIG